jgi:hypothetical protein
MRKYSYGRCIVEVKVGDIYVRHSDGSIWRVKKIDNIMVALESEGDATRLTLADIFGLEKAYSKKEPKSSQQSP